MAFNSRMANKWPHVLLISLSVVYLLALVIIKGRNDVAIEKTLMGLEDDVWVTKRNAYETKRDSLLAYVQEQTILASDPYKGRTLILENRLVLQDYTPSDRHAIVTMIGADSYMHAYWMGAVAVIQSLREVQTRVPNIIVMARNLDNLPKVAIDTFKRLGAQLMPIEKLNLQELGVDIPGTWGGAFDKLRVWSLTQFDKVLFLDADTMIVQNVDHLLHRDELTAPYTPRNCACNHEFPEHAEYFTISSGFFVCDPSQARFEQIIELASNPSPDPDDLEQFGGVWHWGDQEMIKVLFTQLSDSWNYLHWEYDLPVGMCKCESRRTKPVYSYHFVCSYPIPKPWSEIRTPLYDESVASCTREIYHLWFRMVAKGLNTHALEEEIVNDPIEHLVVDNIRMENTVDWR